MKIITVTLNPSLDRTVVVRYLSVGYHNRTAQATRLDAAGRGMNICEALHSLSTPTEAIVLVGDDPYSQAYKMLLTEKAFPVHTVQYSGVIRSNIFIKDIGNNDETVIKEDGSEVSNASLESVAAFMKDLIEPDDFVVFAGALPPAADTDTYAWLTRQAHEAGARVVLHTEGEFLREGLKAKPELVILTRLQVESYFNIPVRVEKEVVYCAKKLQEEGATRALIMMEDNTGAILVTEWDTLMVEFKDEIAAGTHGGAFDALLAGYLIGRMRRRSLDKCLRLGAAAAIYTASHIGLQFGSLTELKELLRKVKVKDIKAEHVSAG